ncbi:hypothetical protein ACVRY7_05135 [Streptococcus ictaluri]|uniref:Uncharacterized protein n=1 Tax=Streptococcus ictaluri 707-05 TaxID=764299 RepID=G5K5A3_9STRE|nr:hypothetical protein [Streptococcus ictaluri]EHI68880.1 hypothetical protein STRIC_1997 [Streptococcus ictaluri 707-05]
MKSKLSKVMVATMVALSLSAVTSSAKADSKYLPREAGFTYSRGYSPYAEEVLNKLEMFLLAWK